VVTAITITSIKAAVSGGFISLKDHTVSKNPCRIIMTTTIGRNDFKSKCVTLLLFIRLKVQYWDPYIRMKVKLNKKKQIADGNETGIILLP
jgi:hypothetical protein